MPDPRVVLHSIWRNDEARNIESRIAHLLAKTYPELRWIWVVGDSTDDTEAILVEAALENPDKDILVIRHDTNLIGSDPKTRVKRLSLTYNAAFNLVLPDDAYWCLHESDLISPPDVIERFLASGKCPVAGWVTLGEGDLFYDTWAYRAGGEMFSNYPPYSPVYRADAPFEVDSFGSCALWEAEDLRVGLRSYERDFLEISAKLKERGHSLWVDPSIKIIQPRDLWVPYAHA